MCLFRLLTAIFSTTQTGSEILTRGKPQTASATTTISPRPVALESSALSRLHRDVIIHLARFLPIASVASFALCCRPIYEILGTRYWEALRDQQQEREAFLSGLERDLPDYIFCHHCTILHSDTHIRQSCRMPHPRGASRHMAPCNREELLGRVFIYVHWGFNFRLFQITIKRFRLGLDYQDHLSLLACKTTRRTNKSWGYLPHQFSSQARVIAGSLYLQVQHVLLVPPGRALEPLVAINRIYICPHTGAVARNYEMQLPEDVQCKIAHQHDLDQCIRHSGLKQCAYCPTEYRIDLQECRELGVAVVITKWLDLGEGSIFDPRWWSRLPTRYTDHRVFAGVSGVQATRLRNRVPLLSGSSSIHASFQQDLAVDPVLTAQRLDEICKV